MRVRTALLGFASLSGLFVSSPASPAAAELNGSCSNPGSSTRPPRHPVPGRRRNCRSTARFISFASIPGCALEAVMAGGDDAELRTAEKWCRERHLAVAINMGMYETGPADEHRLRAKRRLPEQRPLGSEVQGGARLRPDQSWRRADCHGGSRQPRRPGAAGGLRNRHPESPPHPGRAQHVEKQDRRWSEAAVGVDRQGRVLFIFSRYPYTMKELNDILLALPLAIDAAMHVEGVPRPACRFTRAA